MIAMVEARTAVAQGSSPVEHEADAQMSFLRAMRIARQQGARMLELRAAIPLAQLRHIQGRDEEEALELLSSLCELFPNTSSSLDVRTAHALLNDLTNSNTRLPHPQRTRLPYRLSDCAPSRDYGVGDRSYA
jgi:hypothetical protein